MVSLHKELSKAKGIHDSNRMMEILLLSLLNFVCEDPVAVKDNERDIFII